MGQVCTTLDTAMQTIIYVNIRACTLFFEDIFVHRLKASDLFCRGIKLLFMAISQPSALMISLYICLLHTLLALLSFPWIYFLVCVCVGSSFTRT